MDRKAATSRNRKMAAATMDSCQGSARGTLVRREATQRLCFFRGRTIRQDGVYRSAPLEYHATGAVSEFPI